MNQVRRVASGGGLRLVAESDDGQESITLTETDVNGSLAALLGNHAELTRQPQARIFLKCGRFLIETT